MESSPVACGDKTCAEEEICVFTPAHCRPCSLRNAVTSSGDTDTETEGECEDEYVDATHVCEVVPEDCPGAYSQEYCLGIEYCYGYLGPFMFSEGVLDCGSPPHTCY